MVVLKKRICEEEHEYLHGIVGLSKAMEIACKNLEKKIKSIFLGLKSRMIHKLNESMPRIKIQWSI